MIIDWIKSCCGSIYTFMCALPCILAVTMLYVIIRSIWHKVKFKKNIEGSADIQNKHGIIRLILVFWVTSIICLSITPNYFWECFYDNIANQQSPFDGYFGIGYEIGLVPDILQYIMWKDYQAVVSIALPHILITVIAYIPLGFLASAVTKRPSFIRITLIGFLLSFSIEVVQHFTYRQTSIDDLICNTLGTIIGWSIYTIIKKNNSSGS